MNTNRLYRTIVVAGSLLFMIACDDFLQVETPKTQITSASVFTSDATAISAIAGVYSTMMNSSSFASGSTASMSLIAGLSADEFIDFANSTSSRQLYRNSLDPTNATVDNAWVSLYQYIYYANAILEGLAAGNGMTSLVKQQLEGEALFIRAFSYFYLVNLFGDVPIVTTTDFRVNATSARRPVQEVYQLAIADLLKARDLMVADYSHTATNRIRPNSFAASAMLARIYLYQQRWADAETEASRVIMNTAQYGLVADLNSVFLKNSREAIWQLTPTVPQFNTYEATVFRTLSTAALSDGTVNAFEPTDRRKTNWLIGRTSGSITYQSPNKYKIGVTGQPLTEFSMVIRLSELYLIRAEARAMLSSLPGAAEDLNAIRQRAGLLPTSATTQADMVFAIERERRVELFSEWGHRWLDLKRSGRADAVLGSVKAEWNQTDVLYPIPKIERDNNSNITQNPGY